MPDVLPYPDGGGGWQPNDAVPQSAVSWPGNSSIFIRESIQGRGAMGNLSDMSSALSTGVMTSVAVRLFAGDVITNITFVSGNTASTPTHYWFALYDDTLAAPVLLSQSADQTSTAWAQNTAMTLALGTPQLISRTGIYYASCMMSGTVNSLIGVDHYHAVMTGAIITGQRKLSVTSGSSLTATAPGTIVSAGTAFAKRPYCALT